MKRCRLFLLIFLFLGFTSPAFSAFRMNAAQFAEFCKHASLQDVKNAINSGVDWDLYAIYRTLLSNPDPNVSMFLIEEAKKSGIDVVNMDLWVLSDTKPLRCAVENPNPVPLVRMLLEAGARVDDWGYLSRRIELYCVPSARAEVFRMINKARNTPVRKNNETQNTSNEADNMTAEQMYSRAFQFYIPPGDTRTGISENNPEAMKWFRLAAERGHKEAQFWLGHMYELGKGTQQNSSEAVKWWTKSAEQGLPLAQYWLAHKYANGQGVHKNEIEALNWWRKAAVNMQEARDEIQKYIVPFNADGFVTGNRVNVRTEPYMLPDNVITRLSKGDNITITRKNGDWYFIETEDGSKGWMSGRYLKYEP